MVSSVSSKTDCAESKNCHAAVRKHPLAVGAASWSRQFSLRPIEQNPKIATPPCASTHSPWGRLLAIQDNLDRFTCRIEKFYAYLHKVRCHIKPGLDLHEPEKNRATKTGLPPFDKLRVTTQKLNP